MRELLKRQEQEALQHALNKGMAKRMEPPQYTGVAYIRKEHKYEIPVPEVFSLVTNVDEMLMFYKTIYAYAQEKKGIFLDMSKIRQISVDAILYTISVFDHLEKSLHFTKFGGNFPNDEYTHQVLLQSSFFNYVKANFKFDPDDSDILSVKSGQLVRGKVAQQVINFGKAQLGRVGDASTRSMYATLIECMVNTGHHAYEKRLPNWKWWLMALPDRDKRKVHFAFLDNGRGIPVTVRKNFRERVLQLFGNTAMDSRLIQSTLEGEYRTRIKNKWRGKGLPKIYSYSKNKLIENLRIISNHGYVECDNDQSMELRDKFHGTLLYWEFV
jgi:hypothetical protein